MQVFIYLQNKGKLYSLEPRHPKSWEISVQIYKIIGKESIINNDK